MTEGIWRGAIGDESHRAPSLANRGRMALGRDRAKSGVCEVEYAESIALAGRKVPTLMLHCPSALDNGEHLHGQCGAR